MTEAEVCAEYGEGAESAVSVWNLHDGRGGEWEALIDQLSQLLSLSHARACDRDLHCNSQVNSPVGVANTRGSHLALLGRWKSGKWGGE